MKPLLAMNSQLVFEFSLPTPILCATSDAHQVCLVLLLAAAVAWHRLHTAIEHIPIEFSDGHWASFAQRGNKRVATSVPDSVALGVVGLRLLTILWGEGPFVRVLGKFICLVKWRGIEMRTAAEIKHISIELRDTCTLQLSTYPLSSRTLGIVCTPREQASGHKFA